MNLVNGQANQYSLGGNKFDSRRGLRNGEHIIFIIYSQGLSLPGPKRWGWGERDPLNEVEYHQECKFMTSLIHGGSPVNQKLIKFNKVHHTVNASNNKPP